MFPAFHFSLYVFHNVFCLPTFRWLHCIALSVCCWDFSAIIGEDNFLGVDCWRLFFVFIEFEVWLPSWQIWLAVVIKVVTQTFWFVTVTVVVVRLLVWVIFWIVGLSVAASDVVLLLEFHHPRVNEDSDQGQTHIWILLEKQVDKVFIVIRQSFAKF